MAYRHHTGVFDPKFKKNQQRRDLEDMLGEWYGEEFAASEITCRTDPPCKLGDMLDAILQDKLNDQTMQLIELREKWDSIIGTPLNKFTRMVNIRDAVMTVEVSHPAFLMELRKKGTTESCIQRIKTHCPALEFDSISFVPAGQIR